MAKWWRSMRCGSITGRRTAAKHRSGAEAAAGRRDSSPPTPELSTGKTNPQAPGWNKRTRVGLAGRTRMKLVPAKSSVEARHRGGSLHLWLHAHMWWLNLRLAAVVEVVVSPVSLLKGSRRLRQPCASQLRQMGAYIFPDAFVEASSGARGEGDHLVEVVRARDRWRHFLRLRGRKVNL
uniref:Uncharacterized protein n=2 Tax=Aegilops tauschii subsp. strangulata TaxID=200361 RepID=A0A453KM11_AEGTS